MLGAKLFSYLAATQGELLSAEFEISLSRVVGETRQFKFGGFVHVYVYKYVGVLVALCASCRPNTFKDQYYSRKIR